MIQELLQEELQEANVTMKLAQYAKEELEQYEGVKVYLTRYNNCPTIYNRVEIAKIIMLIYWLAYI